MLNLMDEHAEFKMRAFGNGERSAASVAQDLFFIFISPLWDFAME